MFPLYYTYSDQCRGNLKPHYIVLPVSKGLSLNDIRMSYNSYIFCFSSSSTFLCSVRFEAVHTLTLFSRPSMYSTLRLRDSLADILFLIFLLIALSIFSSSLVRGIFVGKHIPSLANKAFSSSDKLNSEY